MGPLLKLLIFRMSLASDSGFLKAGFFLPRKLLKAYDDPPHIAQLYVHPRQVKTAVIGYLSQFVNGRMFLRLKSLAAVLTGWL